MKGDATMPEKLIKKVDTIDGPVRIDYNALANLPDLSVIDELNTSLDEVKSDLSDATQTYETKKDAAQKLVDAKAYTDEQIAAIPEPTTSWNDLTDKPFGEESDGGIETLDEKYIPDTIARVAPVASNINLSALETDGTVVETFPDGSTKTSIIEFDADGNPVKITDGDGNETVLTW
jgi:hypothetical protein